MEIAIEKHQDKSTIENKDIISIEEEWVSQILQEKNLDYANRVAEKVYPRNTIYTRIIKRALDIMVSLPVFIVLLPLNCFFALCTFLDVGNPILYKQTRVGKDGKFFTIVKFRTMIDKRDEYGKLLPPSQRVTKFGLFMRKFSLDELLNFWSVLKGDMSIIGPRPLLAFTYEHMNERHKMSTAVRPGLECPRVISVKCKNGSMYQQSYENAVWYVENVSFWTDIKMLCLLVKMVFSLHKREKQAHGVSCFVGYDDDGCAISLNKYKELYMHED